MCVHMCVYTCVHRSELVIVLCVCLYIVIKHTLFHVVGLLETLAYMSQKNLETRIRLADLSGGILS